MGSSWRSGRPAVASLLVSAWAAGCATAPPPRTEIDLAGASLLDARAAGADSLVTCSMYMDLAQREIRAAMAAAADQRMDEARRLAVRAQADADLALFVAHEAGAREAAERTTAEADRLAEELR